MNCLASSASLVCWLTGMSKLYDSVRSLGTDGGSPTAPEVRQEEQPMPSSEGLGESPVKDINSGYKNSQQPQQLQHQKDAPLQDQSPTQQPALSLNSGAQRMSPVIISQARPVIYLLHNASTRQ